MAASQKFRIAMLKRGMTLNELAEEVSTSPQNLSNKFRRDNLSEDDMHILADALGCDLMICLIDKETGTQIV